MRHFISPSILLTLFNNRTSYAEWRRHWLKYLVVQPAALYLYACLPRLLLTLATKDSELPLTRGVLDRRLAYVSVVLAVYHLPRLAQPTLARRLVLVYAHLDFLTGCLEAVVLYEFGVGYSPLFFYHVNAEAIRLAVTQYWPHVTLMVFMALLANWVLQSLLFDRPWSSMPRAERAAALVVMLLGVRSTNILYRYGVAEEFAPFALVMNWRSYVEDRGLFERLHADDSELAALRRLRIGSFGRRQSITPPTRPLNLITVYLEGFQANLTGDGPVPGLTPQLDRFAAHAVRFENFYNAVTPTINALISSQCGILAEIENSDLTVDRGYTRNLRCLSDRLHEAGYYQVFMGGADSQFSGKRLFLTVHQYDEVWGWEQWKEHARYAVVPHNDWGLHDTDLVREALARVRELRDRGPFHLSLLTVNTHPPGFLAPDCPSSDFASAFLQAVSCTDFAVGLLLNGLELDGVLDDTIVVLMGDHTVLPSPENTTALGPLAVGWFDKVYMALRYPGGDPRVITTPSYTPDMAPIILDALNFSPVPRFAFGQSTLRADRRPTVVAHHFQILGSRLLLESRALATSCSPTELEHTRIGLGDQRLSACERERIVKLVEKAELSNLPLRRSRSAQ